MIKLENLHKSFGDKKILDGIDITVTTGETVAVIGPSGSGKSTTLRCINLLETPDKGILTINDKRYNLEKLTKKEITEIRRSTAMVFQNFSLFENKTALENIVLPLVKSKKISRKDATEAAMELLEKVGLSEWKNHYPSQLSGGQQQRIGIARALALKPSVILFDEPTSALDPEMVKGVLGIIKEISKERVTSIIVTHELSFALEVADRVVFMEGGYIIEEDDAETVLIHPKEQRTKEFLGDFFVGDDYVI